MDFEIEMPTEIVHNEQSEDILLTEGLNFELFRLANSIHYDISKFEKITNNEIIHILQKVNEFIENKQQPLLQINTDEVDDKETPADSKELSFIKKAKNVETDLKKSIDSVEDVPKMRMKINKLILNSRKDKQQRVILEDFVNSQNKKISLLVEHVDKLMRALKNESTKSIKSIEINQKYEKESQEYQIKIEKMTRILATNKRLIGELREGGKVLEDQLRLMDEKYLELRTKLDLTRIQFTKELTRTKDEATGLRTKYALANQGKLLDKLKLDSNQTSMLTNSMDSLQVITGPNGMMSTSLTNDSLNPNHRVQFQSNSSNFNNNRPSNPGTPFRSSNNNSSLVLRPQSGNQPSTMKGLESKSKSTFRPQTAMGMFSLQSSSSPKLSNSKHSNQPMDSMILDGTGGSIALGNSLGEFSTDKILNKIKSKVRKSSDIGWTQEDLNQLLKGNY